MLFHNFKFIFNIISCYRNIERDNLIVFNNTQIDDDQINAR